MKKIARWFASALAAAGIMVGTVVVAPVAFAAPAQAYTAWYSESIRCDWIDTYYNVNYDWWEETFQNKRDYRVYISSRYQYNWACHATWNF